MRNCEPETVDITATKAMILSRIGQKVWQRRHEKTVEIKASETSWPVYRKYRLLGSDGLRYVLAVESGADFPNFVTKHVDPRTSDYAGLFLVFARWFEEQDMEPAKDEFVEGTPTLDTKRNGRAAELWAHEYGVLGLGRSPYESFGVVRPGATAEGIAAKLLGTQGLGFSEVRAKGNGQLGGKHETVEGFVQEALTANIVLKLYEAATAPTINIPAIAQFMPRTSDLAEFLPAEHKTRIASDYERYSGNAEDARLWAFSVVEDAIVSKVENDVYPTLLGEHGSYKEAWGFKSLLGAMWFQMMTFMLGEDNMCSQCGRVFHKTRRDKTYCSEECGNRARAARGYERKKRRQQEAREATRRRLRR